MRRVAAVPWIALRRWYPGGDRGGGSGLRVRRDAFHLAEALRTGIARLCTVSVPSARARQGRGLLQARATIVKQCTISRNAELELQNWPEAKRLLDMPGFGPIVTLAVASAIDDPHRFKRQKQVASYGRIVPSVRDSGGRESHGEPYNPHYGIEVAA